MYEFYFGKGTIAFSVLIALEEIGADYFLQFVDFARGEQLTQSYLDKNPKGRVPLLVAPEGAVSETSAILNYLAMKHPDQDFAPKDVYQNAKMQEYLSYFASTFHVTHSMRLRGARWSDKPEVQEELKAKVTQNMNDCAKYVQDNLLRGPYLLGDYSIADMHLYSITNWFEGDGVDIHDFPKLKAWRDNMEARDAVKRAIEKSEGR